MYLSRSTGLLALATWALVTVLPETAPGQEPERNVTVRDRPRPDFDPLGIRAGSFLIFPDVSVVGEWDDNIFATKNDTTSDFIVRTVPSISVVSNFPRHALRMRAFSDVGRYLDEDSEDYLDYGGEASGRLDVLRDSRITGSFAAARRHEGRDDPEDTASSRPIRYFGYDGTLGYEQLFNRFNVRVLGTYDRRDYRQASGTENQNDRDRNIYSAGLRTGYFISPRFNTFIQGNYFWLQRDQTPDSGGINRDSEGFAVDLGTEIDITGLLFGEVFVGFTNQTFDEDDFDDENGFSYGIGMTWNPTGLTSVGLSGRGGFEPTDTADASSRLQNTISLRVDHELLRNLILGADVGYQRDDYSGIDRVDNRYDVGADVTYLINRNFTVSGGYRFTTRDSDDDTREFDRNVVSVRVSARL